MRNTGRKAELRRLAAKQGWYDGFDGNDPHPPTKGVMIGGKLKQVKVSDDFGAAYWDAYEEGMAAEEGAKNPYSPPQLGRSP